KRGLWPEGDTIVTHFGEGAHLCVLAFAAAVNRAGSLQEEKWLQALATISIQSPHGPVQMDPETQHARVHCYLSRCEASGHFAIIREFGAINPVLPERYGHPRIEAARTEREDSRLQKRILDHMSEGVCLVRAVNFTILYVNSGFERMFGYPRGELLGQSVEVLHGPVDDHPDPVTETIRASLIRQGRWAGDVQHVRKDGTPFWCHLSITAMTDADQGELMLGIHRDITESKRIEKELDQYRENLEALVCRRTMDLEKVKDAAETAARAKESFLVNMSHEIRTPMNGVLGMADLILSTPLNDQQRHYANTIHHSGRLLLRIINDILEFAKIRSGQFDLEILAFELTEVIQHIGDLFIQQAEQKGLTFDMEVEEEIPSALLGDPYRINQILFNLLGNAVKFTEQGSIHLAVAIVEEREADLVLQFTVTDTGIGISPECQGRIFETFTQEDGSVARRFGGTGLGLAIARQLVLLMDGTIWLESVPNQGSCFGFTARFGKQQPGDRRHYLAWQRPTEAQELSSIQHRKELKSVKGRTLLVEDNPVNQEVAEASLRLFGCEVILAENGQQALERFRTSDPPFDLVIMDCELPVLDGFETTRRIRRIEAEERRSRTPIVALTAHVFHESRHKCLLAGMDDYLPKPFSQEDMGTVLLRWLPGGVGTDRIATPDPTPLPCPDTLPSEVLDPVALHRIQELARKGGTDLLNRMVGHYLQRTGELFREIEEALAGQAAEPIRVAAHTLKSSSLTIGAVHLAELGRIMEEHHADFQQVRDCLSQCAMRFDEVKEALNERCRRP
ncbi:MAG: response regulator, partial [Magnetococcales bacterium]|nr:response regulator [Magnetococcales bacterium]